MHYGFCSFQGRGDVETRISLVLRPESSVIIYESSAEAWKFVSVRNGFNKYLWHATDDDMTVHYNRLFLYSKFVFDQ